MDRSIAIFLLFVILIGIAGTSIYFNIIQYSRNRTLSGALSTYIDEFGKLSRGFIEAKQLIRQLGERYKIIANAAREGLAIIEGKFKTEN